MKTDYDSILTAQDTNFINTSQYYKVGRKLPDHGIPVVERPYTVAKDDFVMGGILLMIIIIGTLLYRSKTIIVYRIKDFFSSKRTYSGQNVNENNHEANSTFLMTTISALSISVVLFDHIAWKLGYEQALGIPYWLLAAEYVLIMVFVYFKAWIYALVNWTFFDKESSNKWMAGYLLLTALTSFILLPLSLVTLLVPNSHEIVKWCYVLTLFAYEVLLFFKMFVNFRGKKYGYLLIFLYFCSVELMSAVVMSRIIQWTIDYIIVKLLY